MGFLASHGDLETPGVEFNGLIAHFFLPVVQLKTRGRKFLLDTVLAERGPQGMVGCSGGNVASC